MKVGINATSDFAMPDNLALDPAGNLYISEDPGGSFPAKTRETTLWMARPGNGPQSAAASVERFASLTVVMRAVGDLLELGGDRLFVKRPASGRGRSTSVVISRVR